jgi:serine/threonine protein phosphatase PrpC
MRVLSFITKMWREMFGQAGPKLERERTQPSAAWIQERVHVAIGEEALQSDSGEIYHQWPLPSVPPPSPPYPVSNELPANNEPTMRPSPGAPRNGQTDMERACEAQQHKGCAPRLLVGWLSDPGIKRQHKPNEDSIFAVQSTRSHSAQLQPFGLFIVADGMGGYAHGLEASRLSVQTMIDRVLPKLSGNSELHEADFRQLLIDGVQAANQAIHQWNKEHRTEMGTTITVALVVGLTAFVANVGDSRTYLYRESEGLRKITQDHSVVAYLVEAGIIKPDDIYTHPQRNRIYRSLGSKSMIQVDTFIEQLQPGDTLLLCSDGLWEMVRDPSILQILQHGTDPSPMGQALIEAALEGGGADNISVIVVQVTEAMGYTDVAGLQLLAKPETVELPDILPPWPK